MNQNTIGQFIAAKRREKNLTQGQLAEKLGVTNKTISKWENGKCMPDYSVIEALCRELDITLAELLDGEEKEPNSIRLYDEEQVKALLTKNAKNGAHVQIRRQHDPDRDRVSLPGHGLAGWRHAF